MKTSPNQELIEILEEARFFLALPDNDFSWSWWEDSTEALREVDNLLGEFRCGNLPRKLDLDVLFVVTGPICEVSVSSGWGESWAELGGRFDVALEKRYGSH